MRLITADVSRFYRSPTATKTEVHTMPREVGSPAPLSAPKPPSRIKAAPSIPAILAKQIPIDFLAYDHRESRYHGLHLVASDAPDPHPATRSAPQSGRPPTGLGKMLATIRKRLRELARSA